MKLNNKGLPYLDQKHLDLIFERVYECIWGPDEHAEQIEDEHFAEFVKVLLALQCYNYRNRSSQLAELFPIFEETVGPMNRMSEGTSLWIALGLAIKELYGMRNATLRS
jgi:hypothetical protein